MEEEIIYFYNVKDGKYYQSRYTHRWLNNLQNRVQKQKEVIDKVSSQIKLYGKYNGEKCTRGFSMMSADFNKLLEILEDKEVSE